jgi:hypothetical protein
VWVLAQPIGSSGCAALAPGGEAMAEGSSRSLAFLLGAVATLLPMQGCVDDGVSIHVICPIPPTVEDDGCTWEAGGETCAAEGVLNLRAGSFYRMTLRVESGLKPRARDVPPISEPNGVQITKARVELRDASGARIIFGADDEGSELKNPFDVVATGYLEPNGLSPTTLVVIPSAYALKLRSNPKVASSNPRLDQVVAAIQLTGKTNGDVTTESAEYQWPIRLINRSTTMGEGCLVIDTCEGLAGQDSYATVCTP